jgi:hypothetical protein
MKEKELEKDIEKSILNYLEMLPETFAFKAPSNRILNSGKKKIFVKSHCVGISDIICVHKSKTYFIEVKTSKGRQSVGQKEFQRNVEIAGGTYAVCRSIEDVRTLLISTLQL